MTTPSNSSAKRVIMQIPTASGDMIDEWVYAPESSGQAEAEAEEIHPT
jgi:hypothetical protein